MAVIQVIESVHGRSITRPILAGGVETMRQAPVKLSGIFFSSTIMIVVWVFGWVVRDTLSAGVWCRLVWGAPPWCCLLGFFWSVGGG